jgi:hypothetical protein
MRHRELSGPTLGEYADEVENDDERMFDWESEHDMDLAEDDIYDLTPCEERMAIHGLGMYEIPDSLPGCIHPGFGI